MIDDTPRNLSDTLLCIANSDAGGRVPSAAELNRHRLVLMHPEQVSRREQAMATLSTALAAARAATEEAERAVYEALELYRPLATIRTMLPDMAAMSTYNKRRDAHALSCVASEISGAARASEAASRTMSTKAVKVWEEFEVALREAGQ